MKLHASIQEALLCLLCYHDKQSAGIVRALIPLKYWDPFYREVTEQVVKYWDQYDRSPGEHTLDIIENLKAKNENKAEFYDRIYLSLENTNKAKGFNPEYMLKQAKVFARYQKLKDTLSKCVDEIQGEDEAAVQRAEVLLHKALEDNHDITDPGVRLDNTERSLQFLTKDFECFPTGIPQLDKFGLGPQRKRLHLVLAPPKFGKSWWLVHLAKKAIMQRLKVAYVTLELDENEVCQRILQSMYSIGKRKEEHKVMFLEKDKKGHFVGFKEKVIKNRPALAQRNIRKVLTRKLEKTGVRTNLIVKEFPTGMLTVQELEGYLDSLEAVESFIPDLLIIDHLDLMNVDAKDLRVQLGRLYKQVRGIGVKRNMAIASVSHTNRGGTKKFRAEAHDVSEDYSKIGTADTVLTGNRSGGEKLVGLARLYVAAGRTDLDSFSVVIAQAYGLGQFCLDSAFCMSDYYESVKNLTGEANGDSV